MRKTKFTWREGQYTNAAESLFALGKEELYIYKLLVQGAP